MASSKGIFGAMEAKSEGKSGRKGGRERKRLKGINCAEFNG